jgi:hypothetical protein
MHFVEQTRTAPPCGNCFQACIASIFELPIEDVPDWNANGEGRWLDLYDVWLAERGLAMVCVDVHTDTFREFSYHDKISVYWIAGVKSPRISGSHAVVMENHKMVWDPHPQRDMGIRELIDCTFFVPLDLPAVSRRACGRQEGRGGFTLRESSS